MSSIVKLKNKFPFLDSTALILILMVNMFNLIIQTIIKDYPISVFLTFSKAQYTWEIIPVYIVSFIGLIFGYLFFNFKKDIDKQNNYFFIDKQRFDRLIKFMVPILLILAILVQFYLGKANLFNLWTGKANALDVEFSLRNSPFGLHGVALLFSYASIILWTVHLNLAVKETSIQVNIMMLLAVFLLISQGKVQGLLYCISAYLMMHESFAAMRRKLFYLTLLFLLAFIVTRYLRNQSLIEFSFLQTVGFMMYYSGSPFSNTCYLVLNQNILDFGWEFFRHLAPAKLLPTSTLSNQLPDITSPVGLIGNGFLLGGLLQLFIYLFLVGFFVHYLSFKSKNKLFLKLFYPFLLVACSFSFLYDHFSNIMFFWIPLTICFIVSRYILVNSRSD